ncbi:hypothetical protein QC763_0027740 [Podospora pseudopauciseta]|uniref:2EXR domain-containing protein n=1 Tax=Podospora pseudopauciseta TaxID=2093780 RepID=A0ABR0I3T2_9PEZI|nr:hypothetical protein QC763_0027740 [Podospora pseudopauciseta]
MPSTEVALSFGRFRHLSGETRARAWGEFMSLEGSDKSHSVGVDIMDRNLLGKKERFNPESNTWAWTTRDELRANVLKMLRRPGTNYRPRVGWHVRQPSVLYHASTEARAYACRRFHTSLLHNGEVELQNAVVRFNPEVDNLSQNFKFVVNQSPLRHSPRVFPLSKDH